MYREEKKQQRYIFMRYLDSMGLALCSSAVRYLPEE